MRRMQARREDGIYLQNRSAGQEGISGFCADLMVPFNYQQSEAMSHSDHGIMSIVGV